MMRLKRPAEDLSTALRLIQMIGNPNNKGLDDE